MNFHLQEISPKTLKLSTAANFMELLANVTWDTTIYTDEICAICARFGADWDGKAISLTFRRNEMSLGEAYFKLINVMGIVGAIGRYIYYPNKP